MFIDTHVHLNDDTLYEKIGKVLEESIANKVTKWIVVGFDFESSKRALEIARRYDNVFAAIGFHPTEIEGYGDDEYNWLETNAKNEKVVAIGEIGYDFHWDKTTEKMQQVSFERQIEIAKRIKKPMIIHSRDALEKTYQTLLKNNANLVGGVMHSYSGSAEFASNFLKINFLLGISGPVTFKNGQKMKEVVDKIDSRYLLSETDSPYLTPHPYRGTENCPKYIPIIVEEMAKIKNMEIKDMAKIIMENAKRLFNLERVIK